MNTNSIVGVLGSHGVKTATLVLLGCTTPYSKHLSLWNKTNALTGEPMFVMMLITLPLMMASSFDVMVSTSACVVAQVELAPFNRKFLSYMTNYTCCSNFCVMLYIPCSAGRSLYSYLC